MVSTLRRITCPVASLNAVLLTNDTIQGMSVISSAI